MSKQVVNIPRDVEDSYYRYKMPVLIAKVEGKGNGIKTVIENMREIASSLDRPAEYTTKFLGFELGSLTKCDAENNKYIVNGKHDAEQLAVCLDKFIERYVLCKQCRNPETDLSVKGEIINAKCRACGKVSMVDMTHKLSNHILKTASGKQLAEKQAAKAGAKAKGSEPGKQVTKSSQPQEEEVQWSTDTSQAAVDARRRELLGARDRLSQKEGEESDKLEKQDSTLELQAGTNPIPVLMNYFKTDPGDECVATLTNLATKQQWSETTLIKYIFASLFPDSDMRTDFYKKARYLSYVCSL